MRKSFILIFIILWVVSLSTAGRVFSKEIKEEKEEKNLETEKINTAILEARKSSSKLSSKTGLYFGYDSNVNLTSERKGDVFEEFLYSLDFSYPLMENVSFLLGYDLDARNYSEFTDISTILNHFKFSLERKISSFRLGGGYDLNILYYPHNKGGDFLFHKGFFYIGKNISKRVYHKFKFEYGYKDYTHKKALSDVIGAYQNKDRLDRRLSGEYSISSIILPRLAARFRIKFSLNNSNARYVDFYDYKSLKPSLSLYYKLLRSFYLFSNFSYLRRRYDARTVTSGDYKQKDNVYAGRLGMIYKLDKRNTLSLSYTYRENSSNDSFQDYSESVITCGWQYSF